MKIVCVGGGPAGLLLSILMKEQSAAHEITVLERSPAGVTYGWGVVFWDDLLEELRAADRPTADAVATHASRWQGEQLAIADRDPVYLPGHGYAIGRQRLLNLLTERAVGLGVEVLFEHAVSHWRELP